MKQKYLIVALLCLVLVFMCLSMIKCATQKLTMETFSLDDFTVNYPEYGKGLFVIGAEYYSDRDYVIETIPEALLDYYMIQSKNNDKMNAEENFFSITLLRRSNVIILYDHRFEPPEWLDWTMRDEVVTTSDTNMQYFDVYQNNYIEGTYTFGGNEGASSMYVVLVEPYYEPFDPLTEIDYYSLKFYPVAVNSDTLTIWDETEAIELSWLPPLRRMNQVKYPPLAERIGEPITFTIYNDMVVYDSLAVCEMEVSIPGGDYEITLSVMDLDELESIDSIGLLRRVIGSETAETVLQFQIIIKRPE